MAAPTEPPPLPPDFKDEAPITKAVFLWLEPQGEVSHSVRDIAEALGVAQHSAQTALARLRELGLLIDLEPARGNAPGRYRTKRPDLRDSDSKA